MEAHWSWHKITYEFVAFENSFIRFCFVLLQNEAVDVDIDEILDMDTDDIRRSHLFVSRHWIEAEKVINDEMLFTRRVSYRVQAASEPRRTFQ